MTWDYFEKFDTVIDKYMPSWGEGETMASQITTAINKLIYKWYNEGDVYDNTYFLEGLANDLSSYANWLRKYCNANILDKIKITKDGEEYELLLSEVADMFLTEEYLGEMEKKEKVGSIYCCDGPFRFFDEDCY